MLTRQTKEVLKGIKCMTEDQDHEFAYSDTYTDGENDLYCPTTDKAYDYGKHAGQIEAIIDYLILQGYLSVDSSRRIPMYRLTYLGMHYGRINWLNAWDRVWTQVLVPAIVALIVSFITSMVALRF